MADPVTIALAATAATSLLSVGTQLQAGKAAVRESELTAQAEELGATQRETDRKGRLANALATANAQAGAAGIAAFEGSPLTILQESITTEETATERDAFNTRISALRTRGRGQAAKKSGQLAALTSLVKAGAAVTLIPGDPGGATLSGSRGQAVA